MPTELRVPPPTKRRAFTLIEVLIVVVILGILASISVAALSNVFTESRQNVAKTLSKQMSTQIQVFRQRHGIAPGVDVSTGQPSKTAFVAQLTKYVDLSGNTSDVGDDRYKYGPYFSQIPQNPLNSKNTVLIVGDGEPLPNPDNSTGWIFKPETLELYANTPGYGPGSN